VVIADTAAELGDLWPALAAALQRDTITDTGTTHSWAAAVVVNADVFAAMLTIDQEIPQAARLACEAVGEPWQHRDLNACLTALPRLADRLHARGTAPVRAVRRVAAPGETRPRPAPPRRAGGVRVPPDGHIPRRPHRRVRADLGG
jgi:hypothetical protein